MKNAEFIDLIQEEYEEIRNEHYESLLERRFLPIEEARKRKLELDWSIERFKSHIPQFLGSRIIDEMDIGSLIPYIDWKPFFDVWQLRGKYPNRGYPKIFMDKDVGEEAKKVFNDVQVLCR